MVLLDAIAQQRPHITLFSDSRAMSSACDSTSRLLIFLAKATSRSRRAWLAIRRWIFQWFRSTLNFLEVSMRNRAFCFGVMLCLFVCLFFCVAQASAQARMTDKDIVNVMKNLVQDTKQFQSLFNSAISKSTIRKTSQEKDAKAVVQGFRNQTQNMLQVFQSKKKADTTLPTVLDSSQKIDKWLADVPLNSSVTQQWAKVKAELSTLSDQFNIAAPAR
jgi:hypothetical protein